jgi:hypothetical protein
MKAFWKWAWAAPTGALLVVGVYIAASDAEPASSESSAPLTTKWTGYLVTGTDESTVDRMPLQHAHPKTITRVEIGLRSDGVVVWRDAVNNK